MRNTRKTNVQLVSNMMDYSKQGALMQAFVVTAISKYAEEVAASTPANYPNMGYISPEAWIACGVEAQEIINKHFES